MLYKLQRKLNNVLVYKNLLELNSHDLHNEKKITCIQDRNVRKLMRKAYKVPFYRAKFDAVGLTPADFKTAADLVKFPLLTKNEIRNWITTEINKDPEKYKDWYRYTTSGSSGTPLMTCASPAENARVAANWLRIIINQGIHIFTDKTMALKDPVLIKQRNGKDSILQKFGLLQRHVVSFLADGKTILEELNREKPAFIYFHRSKMIEMLMYAEKEGLPVHKPKSVCLIGEGIDKNTELLINKYFPGIVYSSYGAMETGASTVTAPGDYKKHIVTRDTHVINVIDDAGNLCDNGRMVVTNLFFYKFPIINYDIGDGCEVRTEPDTGLRYITGIKGKMNDLMFFADGSSADYHAFYAVMERRNDILQFRIVQKSYELIEVQLVKNKQNAVQPDEEICREIEAGIREFTPQKVTYTFTWHDELLPDKNGKRRFIVSEIAK